MTNKKSYSANLIYSILLGSLICVIGFFLILFCVSIFRSGEKPFTRDVIGTYLSRLAIPSALCLAAILFAPFFELIFPAATVKLRASRDVYAALRREKHNLAQKLGRKIPVKETKKRLVLRTACICLCALSFVPALVYVLTPTNFSGDDTTGEVLHAAIFVLVCGAISGAIFLAISHFERRAAEAELKSVRALLKESDERVENTAASKDVRRFPTLTLIRVAVLVLGLALIVLGIVNGGSSDVLGKAINICYECIGLG